jgi:hypothetical protein
MAGVREGYATARLVVASRQLVNRGHRRVTASERSFSRRGIDYDVGIFGSSLAVAERRRQVDRSRKNIRQTGEPRAAAVEAILQVANERAGNTIARVIAELHAGGATSLKDIAAGLNQRGITTARGGTWSARQVARVLAQRIVTE